MFLLVSGRHVGAHQTGQDWAPTWRPIRNSVIFRGTFSRITRLWDIAQPCGFHTLFMYHSSTTYPILDFIYWMVEDFIFLLAWRCVRWKPPIALFTEVSFLPRESFVECAGESVFVVFEASLPASLRLVLFDTISWFKRWNYLTIQGKNRKKNLPCSTDFSSRPNRWMLKANGWSSRLNGCTVLPNVTKTFQEIDDCFYQTGDQVARTDECLYQTGIQVVRTVGRFYRTGDQAVRTDANFFWTDDPSRSNGCKFFANGFQTACKRNSVRKRKAVSVRFPVKGHSCAFQKLNSTAQKKVDSPLCYDPLDLGVTNENQFCFTLLS